MSFLRITLAVLAAAAVGNPILIYFMQDGVLFPPVPMNEGQRAVIRSQFPRVEEVTLAAADGTPLHGWFQRASAPGRAPLILYFGGNAEDLSYLPTVRDRVPGWSFAAINYRGYGLSGGRPGEKAMFADALAIHDAFARRDDVDPKRIAVMGASLGTGVATYLASQRPVLAAILVTPYDSILALAQERLWFAPMSWILKHRFDSIALAPAIRCPAFFMVAELDAQIPPVHAMRLYESWGAPKRWHVFPGEGHNTIGASPEYWTRIGDFLAFADPTRR